MLSIDVAIFVGFLLLNLFVGAYRTKVKTISDYALGDRNFSTGAIAATIIATWIGGGTLTIKVSETYTKGLHYVFASTIGVGLFLIISYVFAPRMSEFLGKLSIAEAMGSLFGKEIRIITAICGVLASVGSLAIQFKVAASLFNYFTGISPLYSVMISCAVVIFYSAYGGIKAVTFTDMIQFFTFGVFIPGLALLIWGGLTDPGIVANTLSYNPLFDLHKVLDYYDPKFWWMLMLMLYYLMPGFEPTIFQRISMAKNVYQVKASFNIAALVCFCLSLLLCWMGVLLLSISPNLDPKKIVGFIIENYSYPGLIGFTIAGILAMVMSTADSHINCSSILVTHDILRPLGIILTEKKELIISRIFSIVIGIIAIVPALTNQSVLGLVLARANFYMPIVTVPFMFAVLGFRSSKKSVLIGMLSGLITVLIWRSFYIHTGVDSVIPGIIGNIIGLFSSHYLLRQPGGWVGIKDNGDLKNIKLQRKKRLEKVFNNIKNFNLIKFCERNTPRSESTYSLFGLFCLVSVFSTMYSLPYELRHHYQRIIDLVYHSVLISSTIFLSYPVWPPTFKNERFITIAWNLSVPFTLVFAPTLLVIMGNFGELQLMIFMVNLIVISIMLRWQVALLAIFIGVFASIKYCNYFIYSKQGNFDIDITLQFKIMYVLLLFSSVLIAFFKPKQELQELTEEKIDHLGNQVHDREEEMMKALELKYEFLRNISHEVRAPLTGIVSIGQILWEEYDKYSEEKRKDIVKTIAESSDRLISFMDNILDFSKLTSLDVKLNKKPINVTNLIESQVEICKRLYTQNDDLKFVLNLEPNVEIIADKYYIQQTLRNLIINAIQYGKNGKVSINLTKMEQGGRKLIQFEISDEGIGIPQNEIYDIFGPFTLSTRTRTSAGGRGMGLALCKRVIDVHKGKIRAESNGEVGATFIFTLPIE